MGQHLGGLAAEKQRGHTAAPVRRHHDEVAFPRFGRFDDGLIGILVLIVHGLASDARFPGCSGGGVQQPRGMAAARKGPLVSHQHRHGAAGQKVTCDAAQDPFAQAPMAIGAEYDQICAQVLRVIEKGI